MTLFMDLSIIIVSYNTVTLTQQCIMSVIKSLRGSGIRYEIIVIDNVSTDGTRKMLIKKFPQVITLCNRKNVGFGRANNQGIMKARGEYIYLLNSDTIIVSSAIEKLLAFARQHPNAFVGPKLLNLNRTPQTSCGPFLTLPVVFVSLFLKGDYLGLTRWSPTYARKVDWVSGASIMAPKKIFMNDLLFDEGIFMYMDEIDLLYRAKLKGYPTYFYPRSLVVHLGSGSSVNNRRGPVLNIYKGLMYFYQKHASAREVTMLRYMLKIKAIIAWFIGYLLGKEYLKDTYAEAYHLVT
jgi:GT2 family glycosyltransferase